MSDLIHLQFIHQHIGDQDNTILACDIYDPAQAEINVVKTGDAKDFGYAFDQGALTLNFAQGNQYTKLDGSTLGVKRLRLALVSPNATTPRSSTDVNSLSFKIKLGGLMNLAIEKI